MKKTKKMNQAEFAKVIKELTAVAELIRTRQDEKQSVMKDFVKEKQRYRVGKISKKAFTSSVRKINKEIKKLDKGIKQNIKNVKKVSDRVKKIANKQVPKHFRAALTGIKTIGGKKQKKRRK